MKPQHSPAPHLDGIGGVNGDLVVGGVAAGQPQVVILQLEVDVREDELRVRVQEGEKGRGSGWKIETQNCKVG